MAETNGTDRLDIEAGHELTDLSAKNIALFAAALAVLMLVALLVCYGLLVSVQREVFRADPSRPLAIAPASQPGPRLAINPGGALKAMRRQELSRLNSYGWIDQQQGIVHIPIERAMDMLVAKGLPARQAKPQAARDRGAAKQADAERKETR
jgi:hypothetical protein